VHWIQPTQEGVQWRVWTR